VVASDVDVRWLGAPSAFEVLEHEVGRTSRPVSSISSTPASY
jgi:hypothetical protein